MIAGECLTKVESRAEDLVNHVPCEATDCQHFGRMIVATFRGTQGTFLGFGKKVNEREGRGERQKRGRERRRGVGGMGNPPGEGGKKANTTPLSLYEEYS